MLDRRSTTGRRGRSSLALAATLVLAAATATAATGAAAARLPPAAATSGQKQQPQQPPQNARAAAQPSSTSPPPWRPAQGLSVTEHIRNAACDTKCFAPSLLAPSPGGGGDDRAANASALAMSMVLLLGCDRDVEGAAKAIVSAAAGGDGDALSAGLAVGVAALQGPNSDFVEVLSSTFTSANSTREARAVASGLGNAVGSMGDYELASRVLSDTASALDDVAAASGTCRVAAGIAEEFYFALLASNTSSAAEFLRAAGEEGRKGEGEGAGGGGEADAARGGLLSVLRGWGGGGGNGGSSGGSSSGSKAAAAPPSGGASIWSAARESGSVTPPPPPPREQQQLLLPMPGALSSAAAAAAGAPRTTGPCWLRRLARIAASPLAQRPPEMSPCSRHMREASAVSVSLATASTCGRASNATVDAAAVALVSAAVSGDGCGVATAVTAAALGGLPQSALVSVYTAAITKALRDDTHVELANAFSSAYVGINEAVSRQEQQAPLSSPSPSSASASLPLPPALGGGGSGDAAAAASSSAAAAPEFLEALLKAAGRTARAAGCRESEPFLRELWTRMRAALPRVAEGDMRRWFGGEPGVRACGFSF